MPKPSVQDIARQARQLKEERALEQDEAISRQRVAETESEMRKLRLAREEELRQRRQPPEAPEEQMKTTEPSPLPEVSTKPKRGLFGAGQRIKTAQQKAQPETVGRRIGG